MKTVLDISKKPQYPNSVKAYTVGSVEDIFKAIEDALKENPMTESIKIVVAKGGVINRHDLVYKNGFDFSIADENVLQFRGYTRWVYYKDGIPILFEDACSALETPPHRYHWLRQIEFDKFEKVKF